MQSAEPTQSSADVDQAAALVRAAAAVVQRIGERVVGQAEVIEQLMVTLLAGGHGLFVGVPGLAKTTLVQALASAVGLQFARVQFTPDLMPSDITGTEVLSEDPHGHRLFRFVPGPVFCNLLLADEINRTPPKTQAALLQAMQEGCVTAGGTTHALPAPFHVFATQNPLEQQGTYPLPEAQLDRFMMFIEVDYPGLADEIAILRGPGQPSEPSDAPLLQAAELQAFTQLVQRVPVADSLLQQTVRLVRATRPTDADASAEVRQFVQHGAGPRAAQHLLRAAQARALLHGRAAVDRQDILALATPVLRHRLILNFAAEGSGIRVQGLLEDLARQRLVLPS